MSVTKMQTHMLICTRVLYNNSARKFHMSYRPKPVLFDARHVDI